MSDYVPIPHFSLDYKKIILVTCNGNIAAGKSSALEFFKSRILRSEIGKLCDFYFIDEDIEHFKYLLQDANNNGTHGFALQTSIIFSYYFQIIDLFKKIEMTQNKNKFTFIFMDRGFDMIEHVFLKLLYIKGNINIEENCQLYSLLSQLKTNLNFSQFQHYNLILDTPVHVCLRNLKFRNRPCEAKVTREYLEQIEDALITWSYFEILHFVKTRRQLYEFIKYIMCSYIPPEKQMKFKIDYNLHILPSFTNPDPVLPRSSEVPAFGSSAKYTAASGSAETKEIFCSSESLGFTETGVGPGSMEEETLEAEKSDFGIGLEFSSNPVPGKIESGCDSGWGNTILGIVSTPFLCLASSSAYS